MDSYLICQIKHRQQWGWWFVLWLAISLSARMSMAQTASLNVADFGASGDAVQFYVNTVSNSVVVTTTNQFSDADIGKVIEIFGCGQVTTAPDCQDMMTTIANVVNGTNLYLNQTCQRTLTNTFATVGTDNTSAFAGAIAAASGYTNAVINIPNGTYLLLPTWRNNADGYAYGAICIKRGGLHFKGESQNGTVLLSRGAWQIKPDAPSAGGAFRGFLFEIVAPITNDYPLIFENMTWDGGVPQGNTSFHGFPINQVNGTGWDMQHGAYLTLDTKNNSGTATHQILTNLTVIHWRGEMLKSIDVNTNRNVVIKNCLFTDGNATALNIYGGWQVQSNYFANNFQVFEYYQEHTTNIAWFSENHIASNTGNAMSINGGTGHDPLFVISNNIIENVNGNGFATTPGDNVIITSNIFQNVWFPVVIGAAGYQGTFINSNIVINYNYITNCGVAFQILGGSSTDVNRTVDAQVYGNTIDKMNGSLLTYGWVKDIQFYSNTVVSHPEIEGINGNNKGSIGRYASDAMYVFVQTNNAYWKTAYDLTGKTNLIDYAKGSRFQVVYGVRTNTVYALSTNNWNLYPPDTAILITNSCVKQGDYQTNDFFSVYLNPNLTGDPVVLAKHQSQVFYWNKIKGGYAWMTNKIIPPLNLRTNL
jgi:hypothetical protein